MSTTEKLLKALHLNSDYQRARVQEYIRDNPDMALEYLAALFKDNVARYSTSWAGQWGYLFRQAGDLLTGRGDRRRRLYQAGLETVRQPQVAHVVTCSDPLLDGLMQGSPDQIATSRRVGAWVGATDEAQSSLAAEVVLFRSLGAPVIISLKHVDIERSKREKAHGGKCNCGCAAVAMVTDIMHARLNAVPLAFAHSNAKIDWIQQMALTVMPSAMREAQGHPDGQKWSERSRFVRRALVDDTVDKIRKMEVANTPAGQTPRKVYGAIVDQRTGDLWVRVNEIDNRYVIYKTARTLRQIEDDLNRIGKGLQPRRQPRRLPTVAVGEAMPS